VNQEIQGDFHHKDIEQSELLTQYSTNMHEYTHLVEQLVHHINPIQHQSTEPIVTQHTNHVPIEQQQNK
jgi:hypothetical protein